VSLTRVGVAGLGLIGGSIARRLSELPDLYDPIGYDVQQESRAGLELAESIESLARRADMVIVAVPPKITGSVIAAVLNADPDVLVTDVASVKEPIVDEVGPQDRYLPSHPLAGSETSGWRAAKADLLHATTWAVCPPSPDAPAELLCRWGAVFDAFDARLIACDPHDHDVAVAHTSHAPHVLAAAVGVSLAAQDAPRLTAALSGGSLRDIARLARSDQALWREILELNGDNTEAALNDVRKALDDKPAWDRGAEMAELVHELRWTEPAWEQREFEWPAWDELMRLGRDGVAIRRPAIDGGRLTADVAEQAASKS
jgi:prephenate dehydrogenase